VTGANRARAGIRDGVRRWLRLPLRDARHARDEVDDELEAFVAARVDQLVARGMSGDDARREAIRRLGGSLDQARATLRQSAEHRERTMEFREHIDELLHDLRYAARGLAHRLGFTLTVVSTLAIGIGATTSIFSAVEALLLRPLPYLRPDELMKLTIVAPAQGSVPGTDEMVWSYPKYLVLRDNQRAFSAVSAYEASDFIITSGDVERIHGEQTTSAYLPLLGITPSIGHNFDADIDAHGGARREAIISDALWKRRFNGDPHVVGKTIDLDRAPFTIVGVAPEGFSGLTGGVDVFVPITIRSPDDLNEPFSHEFSVVGRRRPGVTEAQARSETARVGAEVARRYPDQHMTGVESAKAEPLNNARVAPLIRRSLWVLFGAVGLVLLVACVNIANLMLARAGARGREMAVRLALGARRGRLVRLLLAESALLSAAGALASLAVAALGTHVLSGLTPAALARGRRTVSGLGSVSFSSIHLDGWALAFTAGVACVVGVAFGLAPAFRATRASVADTLKDGAVDASRSRRFSGRRLLVIFEVALALILLVGSGLMLRSLSKLLSVDTGFDASNVLTLPIAPLPGTVPRDSLPGVYEQILTRLAALPGVRSVSITDCPPLNGGCNRTLAARHQGASDPAHDPLVMIHWVSPDWFKTVGVPLRRGRPFTGADRAGAAKVIIINETAARKLFPGEDPIGQRLSLGQGGFGSGGEIVGVVGDVRQFADSVAAADTYIPYAQSPRAGMFIFVKTSGDPVAYATSVRHAVHEIVPRFPLRDVKTLAERTSAATATARFSATLLALFAAVALTLSVIGIYGVMSLMVTQRRRELGIRMALGADQGAVRAMVVREAAVLAALGTLIGLAGAVAFSRVLSTLLFEVEPIDPPTYGAIVLVLGAAALAASWIPARRATRVDPTEALRQN